MNRRQCARRQNQTAIAGTREGNDGALDLDRVVHINRAHVHADRSASFRRGNSSLFSSAATRLGISASGFPNTGCNIKNHMLVGKIYIQYIIYDVLL
jgi:hypothetical protein